LTENARHIHAEFVDYTEAQFCTISEIISAKEQNSTSSLSHSSFSVESESQDSTI